jgi:acyl-CoA thioesterase
MAAIEKRISTSSKILSPVIAANGIVSQNQANGGKMKNTPSLTKNKRLELLKKNNECGLAQTMGIEITDLDYGYAKSKLTVGEKHLNVLGILHGAAVMCLTDHTAEAAGTTIGLETVALQINANFASASFRVEETICCEARFVDEDEQIVYMEITVHGEKGDLIAKASTTLMKILN